MSTAMNSGEAARLQRLDEAGQWVLRMQASRRSDEELNEWLGWVDAHPENFAVFERLQRDWEDFNAVKTDAALLHALRGPSRARRVVLAVAAGLCTIALGVALWFAMLRDQWQPPASALQVAAESTNRSATLPDGSKMILGAQSRVNIDFNGPRRQLDLSAGEAYFKVKHDRERPFVVQAGEISVTAIGTAFDVRRRDDTVTITVEEGVVEVSAPPATWRAEAGYQVTYSIPHRTASIASVNPSLELAWRNGDLAYVREPLGSVIEDINRHARTRISIEDPAVATLPFTGTAFAASLDDWIAGIEQAYPVTVRRTDDGAIVLRSRK